MPPKAALTHQSAPQLKSKPPAQSTHDEQEALMPDGVQSDVAARQLRPGTILYLQHTIGNHAVQRLLKGSPSRNGETAHRAPLSISAHQADAVQRKIGFEFQINASRVSPVNGIKTLKKGDSIGNKVDGLAPTVDVNQSGDYDLEFVSDAFDEDNDAGWKNFMKSVQRAAVTSIAISGKGPKLASQYFDGGLADYNVNVTSASGVLHITQGIQLEKLHTYLTGFGFKASKTKKQGEKPEKLVDFTQGAITSATDALDAYQRREGLVFSGTLRGEYLSVMALVAGNMSRLNGGGPYLKSYFKSMNRTDVSTMMNHVKTLMLTEIGDNKPAMLASPFTLGDIKALFQVPLWQVLNLTQKLIPVKPFNEDADTWNASGLGAVTRLEWLNALWDGNDILSAKWQKQQAAANKLKGAGFEAAAGKNEAAAGILESVGEYGSKTDTDQTGTSLRPIFEIRDIPQVSANDLEKWVRVFGEYIRNLNAGTETRPFYEVWQAIHK